MVHPSALWMNSGFPPTALNARTGEDTPPGITWRAFKNSASDCDVLRDLSTMSQKLRLTMKDVKGTGRLGRSRFDLNRLVVASDFFDERPQLFHQGLPADVKDIVVIPTNHWHARDRPARRGCEPGIHFIGHEA